jgi:hypothetical protein
MRLPSALAVRPSPWRTDQRGVVLLVALIALVAMAFSGMALIRVVDATAAITGNLGFWHSATSAPDAAIEQAIAALFEQRLIADPSVDAPGHGYLAQRTPGESARGVPTALVRLDSYPEGYPVLDAGGGNDVRYVIERMCVSAGPATRDNCTLVPSSDSAMTISGGSATEPPRVPLFRQTIRVDGPGGASLFAQVWLADIAGRRRLSWRLLAD